MAKVSIKSEKLAPYVGFYAMDKAFNALLLLNFFDNLFNDCCMSKK